MIAPNPVVQMRFGFADLVRWERERRARAHRVHRRLAVPANDREQLCFWFFDIEPRRFIARIGVPATRAECPTVRPCPYVRCKWNLWMRTSFDTAGRPGPNRSNHPSSVEVHTSDNCGADFAEKTAKGTPPTVAEMSHALGISERRFYSVLENARRKLATVPELLEVFGDAQR